MKPELMIRHHSEPAEWMIWPPPPQTPPSPTALAQRAPSANSQPSVPDGPPVSSCRTKTPTLIPIRTNVALAPPDRAPVDAVRTSVRSRAHSGHRMPTDVGVMHSGQIGRPQREQLTPVSRSGCR